MGDHAGSLVDEPSYEGHAEGVEEDDHELGGSTGYVEVPPPPKQDDVHPDVGDQPLGMTAGQGDDLVDRELSGGSKEMSRRPASNVKVPCHYNKGGICARHGTRGIRKWKPVRTTLTAADGNKTTRVTRRYYWICEDGPGERGTITWHFKHVAKDTTTPTFDSSTSKEGQRPSCVKKPGVSDR